MDEAGGSAGKRSSDLQGVGDSRASAWYAGAVGERRTAKALERLGPDWIILHDRLLRPGVAGTNIDHIVIGPGGIFAIDTKNRAGDIRVTEDGLYQETRTREGFRLTRYLQNDLNNVIWTAGEMTTSLGALVMPVLCFAGQRSSHMADTKTVRGVNVVGVEQIATWLLSQPLLMELEFRDGWAARANLMFPSAVLSPPPVVPRSRATRTSRKVGTGSRQTYPQGPRGKHLPRRRPTRNTPRRRQPGSPPGSFSPRPGRGQSCLPACLALLALACVLATCVGISVIAGLSAALTACNWDVSQRRA